MTVSIVEYHGLLRPNLTLYAVRKKTLFGHVYIDFDSCRPNGDPNAFDDCRSRYFVWHRRSSDMFDDCLTGSFSVALKTYNGLLQRSRSGWLHIMTKDDLIQTWSNEIQRTGYIVHD